MDIQASLTKQRLIKSQQFPLSIDWPSLSKVQLSFICTKNGENESKTVIKSINDWDDFFYNIEPINSVSKEALRMEFLTDNATYSCTELNSASQIFEGYLHVAVLIKQRGLSNSSLNWYYIGDDCVLNDASNWWLFFIAADEEIILDRVAIDSLTGNPEQYFEVPGHKEDRFRKSDVEFERAKVRILYSKFYKESSFGRLWFYGREVPIYSFDPGQDSVSLLARISNELSKCSKLLTLISWILLGVFGVLFFRLVLQQ